jgi:hypothetical protein
MPAGNPLFESAATLFSLTSPAHTSAVAVGHGRGGVGTSMREEFPEVIAFEEHWGLPAIFEAAMKTNEPFTIGIARAKTKIGLQNLAYNIRRLVTLERMAAA